MPLSPLEKRCSRCTLIKHIDEFYPKRDDETGKIVGVGVVCRTCDTLRWKSARDGTDLQATQYDEYGNLMIPGRPKMALDLFNETIGEEAIKQIAEDKSLQVCADHIGVGLATLQKWLDDEREPYASWARRFRMTRVVEHKHPLEKALLDEATAGNVRAIEFALTNGFPEEYGKKKEVEMTVKRGADEIDPNKYTVEELQQLRNLLAKGSE